MSLPNWKSRFERVAAADTQELANARSALKSAENAKKYLGEIQTLFPEDKTIGRLLDGITTVQKRYSRLSDAAARSVRKDSKSGMPAELKKEAAKAKRALTGKLEDSKSLKVIPWQQEQTDFRTGAKYTEYQMVFRIENIGRRGQKAEIIMSMDTGGRNANKLRVMRGFSNVGDSSKQLVEEFTKMLTGWDGLKGEGAKNKKRKQVAQSIANELNSIVRRMGFDSRKAEVDGLFITAEYRSNNLPKEGAMDVGESEYDRMVDNEFKKLKPLLERALRPYKKDIQSSELFPEEKSWVSITIKLK